jgi:hypothetical protein
MALKTKKNDGMVAEAPAELPGRTRNNPEIDSRLNAFIDANPRDFEYYSKLVKEDPGRAVRSLMLKDMHKHESEMKLVFKQLPAAQEFFERQAPEVQAKIKERLTDVNPFYHEKAFVGEVLREMNRQDYVKNRQQLMPEKKAPAMAIG